MFEGKMLNIQRYIDKIGQEVQDTGNTTTIKPSFLFGPFVTIRFTNQISVSSVFIYGPFYQATSEYSNVVPAESVTNTINDTLDITRYDSDTTLNYRMNDFFSIFVGFKYQGYSYDGTRSQLVHNELFGDSTYSGDYSLRSNAYGTGMGISINGNITHNLYLVLNFSGLYLHSAINARGTQTVDGTEYWIRDRDKITFHVIGYNINPFLTYFFPSYGIAVMCGVRYQYLRYYVIDTDVELQYNGFLNPSTEPISEEMMHDDYNRSVDRFWGITLSVAYSFSV